MKSLKFFLLTSVFSVCSLLSIHTTQALPVADFENDMNSWQKSYPVLKDVRQDLFFSGFRDKFIKSDTCTSTDKVLEKALSEYLAYIFKSDAYTQDSGRYFPIVEKLDPVVRDLRGLEEQKPLLPTTNDCTSLYKVHRIFGLKA